MASSDYRFLNWIETGELGNSFFFFCRGVGGRGGSLRYLRQAKSTHTHTCFVAAELKASYSVEVLGDFTEPDARAYFDKMQRRPAAHNSSGCPSPGTRLDDAEWIRVYEVCGGNPGRLTTVVVSVRDDRRARDLDRGEQGCSVLGCGSPKGAPCWRRETPLTVPLSPMLLPFAASKRRLGLKTICGLLI